MRSHGAGQLVNPCEVRTTTASPEGTQAGVRLGLKTASRFVNTLRMLAMLVRKDC